MRKNKHQKVNIARELRRKATDAENVLWAALRSMGSDGIKYRRQHPIGDYIVDFVCLEKRLVIEVDGGQHNEDMEIEKEGYHVIRFWNNDVLTNTEGVVYRIRETSE